MYDLIQRGRRLLAKLALLTIIIAMYTLLPGLAHPASAAGGGSCNAFAGAYNLGAVWSNGNVSVPTCGPLPGNGGPSVYPYPGSLSTPGYQCVEYSERYLYYRFTVTMPMGTNGAQIVNHYVARYPGLFTAVANGTPYQAPLRGDVLSFSNNSTFSDTGHTAVVASSSVDGAGNGSIVIYEENATSGGSETVNVHSWLVSRQGSSYAKWMHVPQAPPPPPSTMVKTASAVPSPLHHPADFSLHAGTQVAEYNSTTNSFSYQGTWVQPVGAIDWAAAGDFNGDGVADFAIHANNAIYVYLSTKTSFVFQGVWVSPVGAFDWGGVGDFNGDGKADFALHNNNAIYTYLSTGHSFAFQGPWVSPVGAFDWGGVGDFNGDGKADFALHNNNAIYVYLSTGNSFAFQGPWVSPVGAFDWGGVGDVNGDGKADFALHNNGAIYTYLSTGNSFAFQGSWVSPVGAFDSGWLADFNGS